MKFSNRLKRSIAILVTILMMASVCTACSSNDDTKTDVAEQATTVETASGTASETSSVTSSETTDNTTSEDTNTDTDDSSTTETDSSEASEKTDTSDSTTDDTSTITEEEAIELVKQEIDGDYSYIPAAELEERDGNQYYVIYINKYLPETGTSTTLAKYLVKTDGSEVFDMYESENTSASTTDDAETSSYVGEYVRSGESGEVTFIVSEDGSFEMTTVGEVNQTVTGLYKFGVTNSASVIKLKLYPHKNIRESNGEEIEEDVSGVEGSAVIEGDTLTLAMESQESVFTKK